MENGKHSLTIEDVAENNKRSHMRVRVEHAYAAMKHNLSFKPTLPPSLRLVFEESVIWP